MTALQRRFHIASEQSVKLKREAESAYDTLHDTLSREQQKLLLRSLMPRSACATRKSWTPSSPASSWRTASIVSWVRRTPMKLRMRSARRSCSDEIRTIMNKAESNRSQPCFRHTPCHAVVGDLPPRLSRGG